MQDVNDELKRKKLKKKETFLCISYFYWEKFFYE